MVYIIIKALAVIALLGSIAWVYATPGYEPGIAVVVSLSALISAFIVEKRNTRRQQQRAQQHQSVSGSSIGVQAGGNVSIGNIDSEKSSNKHVK